MIQDHFLPVPKIPGVQVGFIVKLSPDNGSVTFVQTVQSGLSASIAAVAPDGSDFYVAGGWSSVSPYKGGIVLDSTLNCTTSDLNGIFVAK